MMGFKYLFPADLRGRVERTRAAYSEGPAFRYWSYDTNSSFFVVFLSSPRHIQWIKSQVIPPTRLQLIVDYHPINVPNLSRSDYDYISTRRISLAHQRSFSPLRSRALRLRDVRHANMCDSHRHALNFEYHGKWMLHFYMFCSQQLSKCISITSCYKVRIWEWWICLCDSGMEPMTGSCENRD